MKANREKILIVDFGDSHTQLIARKVRDCHVYSEVISWKRDYDSVKWEDYAGIVFSGSPKYVNDEGAPTVDKRVFDLGIPILGICYGMQLMAHLLGGSVGKTDKPELGKCSAEFVAPPNERTRLFDGIDGGGLAMLHYDIVTELPKGFKIVLKTKDCPNAAMVDEKRGLYAVQFHPERPDTEFGTKLFSNFIHGICGMGESWTMDKFVEEEIELIKKQVGSGKAICGLSGGVDSSVAAAMVHRAIGDNLTCIFVDHGLLRKGEPESVEKVFKDEFNMNFVHIDASKRFLSKLAGVTDPEQKRKIIGAEFIRVFEDAAKSIEGAKFLVQGTIYPDIIESGKDGEGVIKSHHNVGGLPDDLKFELVEPLKLLFKDEVRQAGRILGLPSVQVDRQPFPGPGLAVRVIGEITEEKLAKVREADAILREEIKAAGLGTDIWQYFCTLPGVRSVGTKNEVRTYMDAVGIRAVHSTDGMTADFARIPYDLLEKISERILKEVEGVNRVFYDITKKPPGTIEWE